MSEHPPGGKPRRSSQAREVPAAEFKATCLELMNRVETTGAEYIITKHGKPVAKLVPVGTPKRKPFIGSMRGTVLKYDRPFDPIDGEYDIDR